MISVKEWHSKGRVEKLNCFHIFDLEAGATDAQTIVLPHGFPTASWGWQAMTSPKFSLSSHRAVYAGYRVFWKTALAIYSKLEQADTIEALTRHQGLPDFHVLAHDYGDMVAQKLMKIRQTGRLFKNYRRREMQLTVDQVHSLFLTYPGKRLSVKN